MPGPKMGPRPLDFDEEVIRSSPTFQRWLELNDGEKLKYACREFIKGHKEDEERLMRRIMIARRNNIRDHETLKKARKLKRPESDKRRKNAFPMADHVVEREMDVSAVEATRSYKRWMELRDGQEFIYNQKYIKGKEGHDWLLKKNIWRRMRYRRENKRMVDKLKTEDPLVAADIHHHISVGGSSNLVDHSRHQPQQHEHLLGGTHQQQHHVLMSSVDVAAVAAANAADEAAVAAAAAAAADHFTDQAAIEAAVAAAENFGKVATGHHHHQHQHHHQDVMNHGDSAVDPNHHPHHLHQDVATDHEHGADASLVVHDPLQAAAAQAALDAAARLAAVTHTGGLHGNDDADDVSAEALLLDDDDGHGVVAQSINV